MVFSFLRTRAGRVLALTMDSAGFPWAGPPGCWRRAGAALQRIFFEIFERSIRRGVLKTEQAICASLRPSSGVAKPPSLQDSHWRRVSSMVRRSARGECGRDCAETLDLLCSPTCLPDFFGEGLLLGGSRGADDCSSRGIECNWRAACNARTKSMRSIVHD